MKNRLRRLSAKLPIKKLLKTTLLFALAFCAGRLTAQVVEYNRGLQTADYASAPQAVTTSADGNWGHRQCHCGLSETVQCLLCPEYAG